MLDRECLVFIEVRFRGMSDFASAAASVDRRKQRKLAMTGAFFLSRHERFADYPVRFDVVAINEMARATPELQWIRDAFRPDF